MKKKNMLILTGLLGLMTLFAQPTSLRAETGFRAVENSEAPVSNYGLEDSNTLPASYVPRLGLSNTDASYSYKEYLPTVRDQGDFDSCWAFATTGLAEADLISDKSRSSSVDFSELQLAYFSYHSVVDPLGGLSGDSMQLTSRRENYLTIGGDYAMTIYPLFSWVGLTDEAIAPYADANRLQSIGLTDNLAYTNNEAHLQNLYRINLKENLFLAKQMILDHGAIGSSYFALNTTSNPFYNSSTCAYMSSKSSADANHAVMLVGWDDNFPKENFNEAHRPANNGAWLVRNSWGPTEEEYHLNSYFWISYEEPSLGTGYAMDFVDKSSSNYYDNNYQYDGGIISASGDFTNQLSAANVFTASADPSGELIKGVSFETDVSDEAYTVAIYTYLTDASIPTSGFLAYSQSGTTTSAGYYTLNLDKSIRIPAGTSYSVVVTVKKDNSPVSITAEYFHEQAGWFKNTVSAKAGQSFLLYNNTWLDYGARENANLRIKAYTDNVSTSTYEDVTSALRPTKLTFALNGGTQNPENQPGYLPGTTTKLKAPSRTGHNFTGWFLDKELTKPITEIPASATEEMTLYAGWAPITYSIIYDGNGATGGSTNYQTGLLFNQTYYLATPGYVRDGYRFTSWNTKADGSGASYSSGQPIVNLVSTPNGALVLYAMWTPLTPVVEQTTSPVDTTLPVGTSLTKMDSKGNTLSYTITGISGGKYQVKFTGISKRASTSVVLPASFKKNNQTFVVTAIGAKAFQNQKKLTSITIGKNVSTIQNNAFKNCTKLKTLTFSTTKLTAKTLSSKAFSGVTTKTTIKVPSSKLTSYNALFKSKGLNKSIKVKKK